MLNMLKLVKWFFIDQYVLGISSGGGASQPANTSATNTTSNIAPWAQAGVTQLIQSGLGNIYPQYNQALSNYNTSLAAYNANPYNAVTNPTGLQAPTAPTDLGPQSGYTPFNATTAQQFQTDAQGKPVLDASGNPVPINAAMNQAYNAGVGSTAGFTDLQNQSFKTAAGLGVPSQYGQATSLAGTAAQGNLGTIAGAGQYGQAGYNAGMSYGQNATNPNAVAAYMNPYLQNTLAPSMQLLNQQYGMQQAANQGAQTQAGAFGGSRGSLQNSLNQQNQMLAQNQLVGNAYNQAYNTANQNMQTAAGLGMQGAQQGLAGIQAQQAGYNNAGAAASNLANMGTQQLGAQQSIAGLQNAYGAQQQQQQQNVLNAGAQNYSTMQAYPMQQLQQLEGLYTGVPTSTSTQNYQAPPSMLSQVAGLGMAGYGLSQLGTGSGSNTSTPSTTPKRTGGRIKAPDNRMKKQGAGLGDLALSKLA